MNANINSNSFKDLKENIYEKPEKDLREIKNSVDHFETELYKEKLKQKMHEDKNETRKGENVVGRFKGIIGKLEEKLNRMSAELKINESFN